MKRMCYRNGTSESDLSDSFYVKASDINYNSSDGNSTCSDSKFIQEVTAKSTPKKNRSDSVGQKSSASTFASQLIESIDRREVGKTNNIDLEQIRERCKVAYECRNNMMCIEGNRTFRK